MTDPLVQPTQPFSAYSVLSLASGVLAGRLGFSPAMTVGIGIGMEILRDPGDDKGRTQAIYDLTTYLVGFGIGLTLQSDSPPSR